MRRCQKPAIFEHFQILHIRKGQAAAGLVMAFGAITILLLVIYFLSAVQDIRTESKFNEVENKVDDQVTLLNYLRTPFDSKDNMADLFVRYQMTKDSSLKVQLEKKTKEILNPVFLQTTYYWRIKIDGKKFIEHEKCDNEVRSVEQDLLLFDGNKVQVELVICED